MNTMQAKWDYFEKIVLPDGVSEIQRTEMKRAFYAGANSFFDLQLAMPDGITEKAEEAMLSGWADEIHQFANDIQNGKA